MFTNDDEETIEWFENLENIYANYNPTDMPEINGSLMTRLGLPMLDMDVKESSFFKKYYAQTYCPADPMTLEIDAIRKHEGW